MLATGAYQCGCNYGFAGTYCEKVITTTKPTENECGPNINCNANGMCVQDPSSGAWKCKCLIGFIGQYCGVKDTTTSTATGTASGTPQTTTGSIPTGVCGPDNKCNANGECVSIQISDTITKYYCKCYTNFMGAFCEVKNTTTTTPTAASDATNAAIPYDVCGGSIKCNNVGACVKDPASAVIKWICKCMVGYTGDTCGNKATDIVIPNGFCGDYDALCSKRGFCVKDTINLGKFYCKCNAGFSGRYCQTSLEVGINLASTYVSSTTASNTASNVNTVSGTGVVTNIEGIKNNNNTTVDDATVNALSGGPAPGQCGDNNNCNLNGLCVFFFEKKAWGCTCYKLFAGTFCEKSIIPPTPAVTLTKNCGPDNTCSNQGYCGQISIGVYGCICAKGYRGLYCEYSETTFSNLQNQIKTDVTNSVENVKGTLAGIKDSTFTNNVGANNNQIKIQGNVTMTATEKEKVKDGLNQMQNLVKNTSVVDSSTLDKMKEGMQSVKDVLTSKPSTDPTVVLLAIQVLSDYLRIKTQNNAQNLAQTFGQSMETVNISNSADPTKPQIASNSTDKDIKEAIKNKTKDCFQDLQMMKALLASAAVAIKDDYKDTKIDTANVRATLQKINLANSTGFLNNDKFSIEIPENKSLAATSSISAGAKVDIPSKVFEKIGGNVIFLFFLNNSPFRLLLKQ